VADFKVSFITIIKIVIYEEQNIPKKENKRKELT